MTFEPGTRVRFTGNTPPRYLAGVEATVVQKQPDEPRYLVDIDNTPRARGYAGGQWCVHELGIELTNTEPLRTIDERAKNAAAAWLERIAPAIDEASIEWANDHPELDRETYFKVHHPALLWRFFYHLSALLGRTGEGWETIYNTEKERDDEGEV